MLTYGDINSRSDENAVQRGRVAILRMLDAYRRKHVENLHEIINKNWLPKQSDVGVMDTYLEWLDFLQQKEEECL